MDIGFGFLILLALAIPVVAVAGFVLALVGRSRVERLERRVADLERRIEAARARAQAARAEPKSARPPEPMRPEPAPEIPAPPPPRSVPDVAAAAPPKPSGDRSFEERLGGRWSVAVGGLALALGGIFLVRYSIEQGWIGPGARVTLGALFALVLLAAGEKLRRGDAASTARRPIDIPATLTAAGCVAAFATVYAAHALYGFLGPGLAFVLLGAVATATLVAAVLHGPILGAAGLIGAYAVPFLVSSDEPNVGALLAYLLAPTAAAFAVARLRGWPGLAIAAGAAAFLWGVLASGLGGTAGDAAALLAYAAAAIALSAFLHLGLRLAAPPPSAPEAPPPIPNALIAAFGLIGAATPALAGFEPALLFGLAALFVACLILATLAPGLAPAAPVAAALALLAALSFDDEALRFVAETSSLPFPGEMRVSAGVDRLLVFSAGVGLLFGLGGAGAARTRPAAPGYHAGLLAAAAVAAPLGLLAIAYWRVTGFAPDLGFATIAVLLAGALAALTEDAARREQAGSGGPEPVAAYAVGASAALGLALAMAMREGALTVALAFLAAALGLVAAARPIRALGVLAMAVCGLVAVRVALDPRIVGDALSTTPIVNPLLWGYGAPAVAFWIGARAFARAGQPKPTAVLEGMALLFALLLGFTQARHFAHGGDLTGPGVRLVEAGLDATVAFGLAALVGRLGLARTSPALGYGALAVGALGLAVALLALALAANPLFTGEPVGTAAIFNDLLVGYLVPALAALAAARFGLERGPAWKDRVFGLAGLALALTWASLETRRAFAGPVLDGPITGDAEWYAYSVLWLLAGLALLAAGILRRSKTLRLASATVVVAVVLKVFLSDMAGLGGVLRALSFMGLGAVLVGIGLVYQRLMGPRHAA